MITTDSIVIAADTREGFGNARFSVIKKIYKVGETYHAESGLCTLKDTSINKVIVDITDTISDVIKKTVNFNSLQSAIEKRLYYSLLTMRKHKPEGFKGMFLPYFIQVSIVRFDAGKPEYLFGIYNVNGDSWDNAKINFVSKNPYNILNLPFINGNGYKELLDSIEHVDSKYFEMMNRYKLIDILKLEAKKHSDVISCPYDIVVIKPNGKNISERITCQ